MYDSIIVGSSFEWITKMDLYTPNDCIAGRLRGLELVALNGGVAAMKNTQPDGMVAYPNPYVK